MPVRTPMSIVRKRRRAKAARSSERIQVVEEVRNPCDELAHEPYESVIEALNRMLDPWYVRAWRRVIGR